MRPETFRAAVLFPANLAEMYSLVDVARRVCLECVDFQFLWREEALIAVSTGVVANIIVGSFDVGGEFVSEIEFLTAEAFQHDWSLVFGFYVIFEAFMAGEG